MIRRTAAGTLLTMMLFALASSAPAGAAEETPNHPFKGSVVGGLTGKPPHSLLEDPCGVAVTPQGDLYIADYYHHQVGFWEHTLGGYGPVIENVAAPNGPCGLALDPAGALYVNHWHGAVTNADGEVIAPGPATGIAVDPASGDLYVNERTSVAVYDAPIVPEEAPALRIGAGSLLDGYGVAVSGYGETAGEVYVADAATHTVKVYDPAAPDPDSPVRTIDGAGTAQGGFVSLVDSSLAIDQSNGHLFVADNTQPGFEHPRAAVDEFNAEGLFRGALEKLLIHGGPVGIAVSEAPGPGNGYVYVTSGNGTSHVFPLGEGPPVSEQSFVYAFGPAGLGWPLEVTRSGAGEGAVASSSAGIACPGSCEAEFNAGKVVSLTATPAPGSAFAGWSGACTGTGSCQVTMSAAATVNAEFVPAPAVLAAPSAQVQGAVALGAAAPANPAATGGKPKRARHRFARAKSIVHRAHRRAKEKR